MENLLHRLWEGHGSERDVQVLENVANNIGGKCLCALGEFAKNPSLSSIQHFPQDYKAKVKAGQMAAMPVAAD
jgi:NADH-quinone oxidoreductase subunit F